MEQTKVMVIKLGSIWNCKTKKSTHTHPPTECERDVEIVFHQFLTKTIFGTREIQRQLIAFSSASSFNDLLSELYELLA